MGAGPLPGGPRFSSSRRKRAISASYLRPEREHPPANVQRKADLLLSDLGVGRLKLV